MLRCSINRRKHRMPTHWEEIPLSRCVWLYGKVRATTEEVRQYFIACAAGDAHAEPVEVVPFAREVIMQMAGIAPAAMAHVDDREVMALASAVLPRFVCGVMGYVDFVASGNTYFRRGGRRYFYPVTGADITGTPTPLSRLSAAELCQVSDIVLSGNLALAPLAVAICCRPCTEEYNEAKAQHRAAVLGSLPTSVYWELWCRVSGAHEYLRGCFPACYGKAAKGGGGGKPLLWGDMLASMAAGRPSELALLERMNGYTFVRLMNEYIKTKAEEWKMRAALSGLGAM